MTRYPDWAKAETAAYELLLAHGSTVPGGQPLPIRPLPLIREVARVLSYEDAAELLRLTPTDFDRLSSRADAFTVRDGPQALVCCRMDGNPARLNFTLAHELGHILLSHTGDPSDELEADHFASCLLIPEPVRRRLTSRPDLTAEDAATLCYVSVAAVQSAMRRRPTAADEALLAQVDALLGPQVDALKPGRDKGLKHRLC